MVAALSVYLASGVEKPCQYLRICVLFGMHNTIVPRVRSHLSHWSKHYSIRTRLQTYICFHSWRRQLRTLRTLSMSWNDMLGVILLLGERLGKSGYPSYDTDCHKSKRNDGPNNTPALWGASILLGKNTGVGGIYFAEDKIVALFKDTGQCNVIWVLGESHNIPDAVQRRHNADKKLRVLAELLQLL